MSLKKVSVFALVLVIAYLLFFVGVRYGLLPGPHQHSGTIKPETQAEIWGWQAASAPPGTLYRIPDPKAEWVFTPVHSDGDEQLMRYLTSQRPRYGHDDPIVAHLRMIDAAVKFTWDNCGTLWIAAILFIALFIFVGMSETDYTVVRHCLKCGYVGHAKLCPSLACEDVPTVCPGFTNDRPFVGGMFQDTKPFGL
jgi:hypothetical protein